MKFPIATAWITCLLALLQPLRAFCGMAKPNVIIILADDQGYGDLSCHGNPVLKTPHLDRLHDESIRLTDFHVAPMCTPTRGQLLTGVDALRNGAMNVSSGRTLLRSQFPTMAEIFATNGYRTAIFGKWHLGDNYPYRPQDRGFQESIWFPSSHISSASDFWNNDYFDDVYWHNGVRRPFKGYCTDVFFSKAMDWMRDCSDDKKPFFCYLALNAAHGPLFVPEKYRRSYLNQKKSIASFFGMIANIDENIGLLETFLKEKGLRENTILIFMTDNGTATGDSVYNAGMRGKKISLYDGGHRVPFFICWPGGKLQKPTDLSLLTEAQDVLPTVIDLCQLQKPRLQGDGTSLAHVLRGESNAITDRMLVTQFSRMDKPVPWKGDATVMWNQWRLVANTELYDISTDPGQQRNVINEFPDIARKMRDHYQSWWKTVEPTINDFGPLHVGSEKENPAVLTPYDWRDVFLDQQAQIRRKKQNGTWTLFVDQTGDYQVSVRRWPKESNLAITAAAPEYKAVDGTYKSGDSFPIAAARAKIGAFDETSTVKAADKEIVFNVRLPRGRTDFQTWFLDSEGNEICGAYYAYVLRK